MLSKIAHLLVRRGEARVGVTLDYAHKIASTNFGLMARYGKIFGFLDPIKHLPVEAYHIARLRGALAADCGTCVEAEINLAHGASLPKDMVQDVLGGHYQDLPAPLRAVARLSDAVVKDRTDDPSARALIVETYGEAGLIELSFAMNGAALLPGIKRAMGYATTCNIDLLRARARR